MLTRSQWWDDMMTSWQDFKITWSHVFCLMYTGLNASNPKLRLTYSLTDSLTRVKSRDASASKNWGKAVRLTAWQMTVRYFTWRASYLYWTSSKSTAQCVHCTVFFPFDRVRWDTLSNLVTVVLLNIYLSQRARSKGTLRKLDFRESQTLNLWISLKYSPVVTTKCAPLFPCSSPIAMVIPL